MKPRLTINIPTFNRPWQLRATLDVIVPQVRVRDDVIIRIVDNCSTAKMSIPDEFSTGDWRFQYVRNTNNIGACANVMRCFDLCDSEWLWILADDDVPSTEALEIIFRDMDEKYVYLTYSIPTAGSLINIDYPIISNGLRELIELFEHSLLRMVFLSSSVYNMNIIREQVAVGNACVNSGAPHTAMLFRAIEDGAKWRCSNLCIADYNSPVESQHWAPFPVFYGLPLMIHNLKKEDSRRLVRTALQNSCGGAPTRFLRDIISWFGQGSRDLAYPFGIIRKAYCPPFSKNPKLYLKWRLVDLISHFPRLSARWVDWRDAA